MSLKSDAGDYSVMVSNSFGTVTSSNAVLTLLDSPYINSVQATPGSHSALISWNTTVPADSQGAVSVNLVALYKALGGGWTVLEQRADASSVNVSSR